MAKRKNEKFRATVTRILSRLKFEKKTHAPPVVPIYFQQTLLGYLRPVTKSTIHDLSEIKRLGDWRKKSEEWFPAQFKVTTSGTKTWVQERLLDTKDRFLFMVETPSGAPLGHVGLFRFNFSDKACEVDNVIRGEGHVPGIMTHAISALIFWTKKYLGIKKLHLEVFSDNDRAIRLYKRCGFVEDRRVPLKKIVEKDKISWSEDASLKKPIRYNVYMILR